MSPQFADFLKSATVDFLKSAGRNFPPVCRFPQICHLTENLQAEIPPPSLQISSNLPLQIYWKSSGRNSPQFADFLKSATAGFLKSAGRNFPPVCRFHQICHCRFTENLQAEIPPSLQISSNLPLQINWKSSGRNSPPQFADFLKSATADLLKIFRQKCPPSLQISSNLPLEIYWNLQAEISPQFADFLKSATADLQKIFR